MKCSCSFVDFRGHLPFLETKNRPLFSLAIIFCLSFIFLHPKPVLWTQTVSSTSVGLYGSMLELRHWNIAGYLGDFSSRESEKRAYFYFWNPKWFLQNMNVLCSSYSHIFCFQFLIRSVLLPITKFYILEKPPHHFFLLLTFFFLFVYQYQYVALYLFASILLHKYFDSCIFQVLYLQVQIFGLFHFSTFF